MIGGDFGLKSVREIPPFEEWGLSEEALYALKLAQVTPEEILWYVRATTLSGVDADLMNLFFSGTSGWCRGDDSLFHDDLFYEGVEKLCHEIVESRVLDDYLWPTKFRLLIRWLENCFDDEELIIAYCYISGGDEGITTVKNDLYESICTDVQTVISELLVYFRPMLTKNQYEVLEFAIVHYEHTFNLSNEEHGLLRAAVRNVNNFSDEETLNSIVFQTN